MKAAYGYGGVAIALAILITALLTLSPKEVLGSYRSDFSARTEAQRENIRIAANAIDGQWIKPGELFSFNRIVGPRTMERGYHPASSYLENLITETVGGGICQVSSTLYAACLEAGVTIIQRVPHRYQVSSVAPGRDATVWYGKADLQWRNDTGFPLRIEASVQGSQLVIALKGKRTNKVEVSTRRIDSFRPGVVCYQTLRQVGDSQWATLDVYLRR